MVCPPPLSDMYAVANSAVETEGLAKMARAMGIQTVEGQRARPFRSVVLEMSETDCAKRKLLSP